MPTPNQSLRRERQLRGWSQVHLAEQIGVPDYYISRWERGDVLPSPYYQQKLCEVFGKTAEELGMLQTRNDGSQQIKVESNPPLSPEDHLPLIEQLPFPQAEIQPSFHDSDSSTTGHVSTPPPLTQRGKQPQLPQRRKFLVLLTLILLMSASAGLGTFLLLHRTNTGTANSIVGHLYFLSSGQTNDTSSQGIADEVQMELPFLPDPSAGKSYYAWLLPDVNKVENQVVSLGKVVISAGTGTVSYSDSQHTNLLAITSQILITEQDANITPLDPSTDRSDWRYSGKIPQTAPSGEPAYSLLDHLRHLLADDPKLKANNLAGGLTIWLYRNIQAVYAWSIDARNDWLAGGSSNVSLMRKDVIRVLDYLDGILYAWRDLPIASPVLVDPRMGRIGLLQFTPRQEPPAYLDHIDVHLRGLAMSPGTNAFLQQRTAQIIAAISLINGWLEQIRRDSKQLAATNNEQLQQLAPTLLNDMANIMSFVLNGKYNSVTNSMQEGVDWIYQAIQSLATIDIQSYRSE